MIEQLPQPLPGIITVSVTVSVPGKFRHKDFKSKKVGQNGKKQCSDGRVRHDLCAVS